MKAAKRWIGTGFALVVLLLLLRPHGSQAACTAGGGCCAGIAGGYTYYYSGNKACCNSSKCNKCTLSCKKSSSCCGGSGYCLLGTCYSNTFCSVTCSSSPELPSHPFARFLMWALAIILPILALRKKPGKPAPAQ